jgi:hypothetical protein
VWRIKHQFTCIICSKFSLQQAHTVQLWDSERLCTDKIICQWRSSKNGDNTNLIRISFADNQFWLSLRITHRQPLTYMKNQWTNPTWKLIKSFINDSTAVCGAWPVCYFHNPIHSRQYSLDGGSARRKPATYTQNTNRINTHRHLLVEWGSNPRP